MFEKFFKDKNQDKPSINAYSNLSIDKESMPTIGDAVRKEMKEIEIYQKHNPSANIILEKQHSFKRALAKLNNEILSDDEKYFPSNRNSENLKITMHNLTNHLLFHVVSQNSVGSFESMNNLVIPDLIFGQLFGGFDKTQKKRIQMVISVKINRLVKHLKSNPNSILEDFVSDVLGDSLIALNLLDLDPLELKNIHQNIQNIIGMDADISNRVTQRIQSYNSTTVMTKGLYEFSDQDQLMIQQKREDIQSFYNKATRGSIGYIESNL